MDDRSDATRHHDVYPRSGLVLRWFSPLEKHVVSADASDDDFQPSYCSMVHLWLLAGVH